MYRYALEKCQYQYQLKDDSVLKSSSTFHFYFRLHNYAIETN